MKKFLIKNKIKILIISGLMINIISGIIAGLLNIPTRNSFFAYIMIIIFGTPLCTGLLMYSKEIKVKYPQLSNIIKFLVFAFIFCFIGTGILELFIKFF